VYVTLATNVKALAMWLEFIAVSARLPMPGKGKMFQVKCKCPIVFLPAEPQLNSITSAQWHFRHASHIANAMLY
jgi:hypothetical protein